MALQVRHLSLSFPMISINATPRSPLLNIWIVDTLSLAQHVPLLLLGFVLLTRDRGFVLSYFGRQHW